jgi:hypothetical protein
MEFKPKTPEIILENTLPRMYENWEDFHFWWSPYVLATGVKELEITDYGNGTITLYKIRWSFVLIERYKIGNPGSIGIPKPSQIRLFRFIKNWWKSIGNPAS